MNGVKPQLNLKNGIKPKLNTLSFYTDLIVEVQPCSFHTTYFQPGIHPLSKIPSPKPRLGPSNQFHLGSIPGWTYLTVYFKQGGASLFANVSRVPIPHQKKKTNRWYVFCKKCSFRSTRSLVPPSLAAAPLTTFPKKKNTIFIGFYSFFPTA